MRNFNEFVGYQKWKEDHQLRRQWKKDTASEGNAATHQVGGQQNQEKLWIQNLGVENSFFTVKIEGLYIE